MNVPEITEVKEKLESLKTENLIKEWELPYENILTRRSAAIFFLTPAGEDKTDTIWKELSQYENFSARLNTEKKLSELQYRLTFSAEEKEQNATANEVTANNQ